MVVVALTLPDVPVMVILDEPVVAALLAVSLNTLLPVVGFVPNVAVTPLGRPEAARVTLPVNPPTSVTLIVSVALLPFFTDRLAADGTSAKPAVGLTVSAMVVVWVKEPLVAVTVTVTAPAVAVLDAASVSTLLVPDVVVVAGLKLAVTPLGKPLAVNETASAKPLRGVIVMALVRVVACPRLKLAGVAARLKLGVPSLPRGN